MGKILLDWKEPWEAESVCAVIAGERYSSTVERPNRDESRK
jgi:hypothetical protein